MTTIGPDVGTPASYPVQFDVDYPDRPLNRLTTFFRLILVIPIVIVLGLVSGQETAIPMGSTRVILITAGGLLFLPVLLLILFRRKYPRWWFDWNLELLRFGNRVSIYIALLRDEYVGNRRMPFC